MSSDETPNQPSREELEERVIALLMGELDSVEAEKIEAAIASDAELKVFHDRMRNTLGLVREAVSGPEISKAPTPLKLSTERREELFAKFDHTKRGAKKPDNVVELRRATRRKWISGVAIAASLLVLLSFLVAILEQGSKPKIAGLKDDLAAEFKSKARRERRNMESHPGEGEAEDAMYKGLSSAQATEVQKRLQPTLDSSFSVAFESASDEAAPSTRQAGPPPPKLPTPVAGVNFVDVNALAETVADPEPMRNVRVEAEKSAPDPVALNIVLPEVPKERDERNARRQFFDLAPKYVTSWHDRGGMASADGEVRFANGSQGLDAKAKNGSRLGREFSVSDLKDETRKSPNFAIADQFGRQAGAAVGSGPVDSFGTVPPPGGPQPMGESRGGSASKPQSRSTATYAFSGVRMSESDEAKGDVSFDRPASGTDRNGFVRESGREQALLFDTETRFDREELGLGTVGQSMQAPENAPAIVAATPTPQKYEVSVSGGAGGGGMAGGAIEDKRLYKRKVPVVAGRKAKLSEVTADDDALAAVVTSRGRNRSGQQQGQAGGQAQASGGFYLDFNRNGKFDPSLSPGQVDGFGMNLSSSRSSSRRSKITADKPGSELEFREKQVTRELAQKKENVLGDSISADEFNRWGQAEAKEVAKRISGDGVLAKQLARVDEVRRRPVALLEAESESLKEQLVDLQAKMAADSSQSEAENKQRMLVESKRAGGMVSGERPRVRGLPSLATQDNDYGVAPGSQPRGAIRLRNESAARPAPAGFDSGVEESREQAKKTVPEFDRLPPTGALFGAAVAKQPMPAEDAEVAKNERLSTLVRDGLAYHELRQFGEADKKLKEALKLDPNNNDAYYLKRLNLEAQYDQENRARDHQFHERVIEVSEAWNRQTKKALPKPVADYSGLGPASPSDGHWAYQAAGKDTDGDSNRPAQVENLFVSPSAPARQSAQMDFDDGISDEDRNGIRPDQTAWMAQDLNRGFSGQSGDRNAQARNEFGWRKRDDKPTDTSQSNREVLRRLNLDLAGQSSSPAPAEEFLQQSRKLSRRSRDKKKALTDTAATSGVTSLRSDLGRTKGIVVGVNNSGVDRSLKAIEAEFTNTIAHPAYGDTVANLQSTPQETPSPLLAAIIPPSVTSLAEEDAETEPQPKVRPQKPKTLEPKPEVLTRDNAFSTFSLNVSDVAFKLAAASLKEGKLPDPESVRSEEFLNALDYHDPAPRGNEKLAFAWDRASNPFAHNRDFLRFSIQTAARGRESGQPLNLVVLLDASGSMERADRVKIVRQMLAVLAGELKPADKISVVAFARTPWLLVDGMKGGMPKDLLERVTNITPQGGTNIEVGLEVAYMIARRHFLPNGNNRVIILTDGAANLGNVDPEALKAKVEEKRKQNIALDCFGVGWEGYNDDLLETLSRNGDGRYGFINDPAEARDGFANLLAGALQVAAANVKAQVEFNPRRVTSYRQIGYTKHQLKKEQFRDNTVDAAEIGAAESGTAMYSIQVDRNGVGPLATVRVRYKIPATGRYVEEEWELPYDPASKPLENAQPSMRLASVAASFAEWMAANPHAASVSLRDLQRHLTGVPEEFSNDERPRQLQTMLQQARRISGE